MRKLLVLSVALFCFTTSTANAHSSKLDLAKHRYYKATGVVHWIGAHARITQYHPNPKIKRKWQRAVHYWVGVKKDAWNKMHPAPVIHYVGHTTMWLCIHAKEGAWDANTGNGYYGGLQMTSGWGGVARPDLLSASEQMALADREYASHGYSLGWIRQQWPRTSYGCI